MCFQCVAKASLEKLSQNVENPPLRPLAKKNILKFPKTFNIFFRFFMSYSGPCAKVSKVINVFSESRETGSNTSNMVFR